MYIHLLTYNERKRFEQFNICPMCGKKIETFDSFEYYAMKYGKNKLYTFFHTSCIVNYHKMKGGETIEEEFESGGEGED